MIDNSRTVKKIQTKSSTKNMAKHKASRNLHNNILDTFDYSKASMKEQLIKECVEMTKFAFQNGKQIPAGLVRRLEMIAENHDPRNAIKEDGTFIMDMPEKTEEEIIAETKEIKHLTTIHDYLTKEIAPATPKTIVMLAMEESKKHAFSFLGPIPFIRRMMVATMISLLTLISVSLTNQVNSVNILKGLFDNEGLSLLLNLLFILSASALGAAFYALFQANKYLSQGTFDPKYEPTYWTRFVLGLVSGMILSELLHIDPKDMSAISSSQAFVKPTLAILGGFSTGAVYRILNRMVEAVESLVQGNIDQELDSKLRISEMVMEQEAAEIQIKLAMHLIDLQHIHDSGGMSSEEMNKKLKQILNDITPTNLELSDDGDEDGDGIPDALQN